MSRPIRSAEEVLNRSGKCALKYGRKCGQKYAHRVCGRQAVCPRQHWGFGGAPSQTTRPPHGKTFGGVRVVWLGALLVGELAGADGYPGVREGREGVCGDLGVGTGDGVGRGLGDGVVRGCW